MKGIKMKKILKYSAIMSVLTALSMPAAAADTGGYFLYNSSDSHWHSISFGQGRTGSCRGNSGSGDACHFASTRRDAGSGVGDAPSENRTNRLDWNKADTHGFTVGADYGFFRLEVDGSYSVADILAWRKWTATNGKVWQARLFSNVLIEPLDFFELVGEFSGYDPLVTYNPAHYGISPYASVGYGVWGALIDDLRYLRMTDPGGDHLRNAKTDSGPHMGGGAIPAVQYGAGLNIGLDKLGRAVADITGSSLPEYFKLPVEFRVGYSWQVGIDEPIFADVGEKLGIDDGGWTYAVGLKW